MKRYATLFLVMFTFLGSLSAQVIWERNYGGSEGDQCGEAGYSDYEDEGNNYMQRTMDGGLIVVSTTSSSDSNLSGYSEPGDNIWLTKLDKNGVMEWDTLFDETDNVYPNRDGDWAEAVIQTSDGGFMVLGRQDYFSGTEKIRSMLFKLDGSGTLIRKELLNDKTHYDLAQGPYGDHILVGWDNITKVSKDLKYPTEMWTEYLDERSAYSVTSVSDGYVVVGSYDTATASEDLWVTKLDTGGVTQWEKMYGGSDQEFATAIEKSSDGGFFVVGGAWSDDGDLSENHGENDMWVLKLKSNGEMEWQASYGGVGVDMANTVTSTSDGGCIVAGVIDTASHDISNHYEEEDFRDQDIWMIELNANGGLEGEENFGGSRDDHPGSIVKADGGGYILSGGTGSSDHDVDTNYGRSDMWIARIGSSIGMEEYDGSGAAFRVHPNPVDERLKVSLGNKKGVVMDLELFDSRGRVVKRKEGVLSSGGTFRVAGLPRGLYFLKAEWDGSEGVRGQELRKLVIE